MIKTTVTKYDVYVTNDVNNSNIELAKEMFAGHNMYINSKFEIPTNKNIAPFLSRSKSVEYINSKLKEIETEVKNGKSQIFTVQTQFDNFKLKVMYWYTVLFKTVIDKIDNNIDDVIIFIDNKLAKHEIMFIDWLAELGVRFFIVTPDVDLVHSMLKCENTVEKTNTSMKLDYKKNENGIASTCKSRFNTIEEVEEAIYNKQEPIKLIVGGITNLQDTSDFYGKLYKKCNEENSNFLLLDSGFKMAPSDYIPRFSNTKHDYILETLLKFIKTSDTNLLNEITNACRTVFNYNDDYKDLTGTIFYNKVALSIATINDIISKNIKNIVYYGKADKNDLMLLRILGGIPSINSLVLISDKNELKNIGGYDSLVLPNTYQLFDMPRVDSRDTIKTMAVTAERQVKDTLFSGDTIGMHKPGQFDSCTCKRFSTIYDEVKLWWGLENYIRPGFEANGNKALVPNMFKLVHGKPSNKTNEDFLKDIQELCFGNTLLFKDINSMIMGNNTVLNTMGISNVAMSGLVSNSIIIKNGKLDRQALTGISGYNYKILKLGKQNMILDAIDNVLNTDCIYKGTLTQQKYQLQVLCVLMNLNLKILNLIQSFEFYNESPRVVITITGLQSVTLDSVILLYFLSLIGFDIIIYVPSAYRTIEDWFTGSFQYDINVIGEASFDIDTSRLTVLSNRPVVKEVAPVTNSNSNKKKSLADRLFNFMTKEV